MNFYECSIRRFMQAAKINMIAAVFVINIVFVLLSGAVWAVTYTAATCSADDVASAIALAFSGDTVIIPAGECTWATNRTYLSVNKAITLTGEGQGITIITLSDSGGLYGNGTIRISAAATVRSMTINGSNVNRVTAFSVSTANGWRITDIDYNGGTAGAYFVIVGNTYGLIDNNDITGAAGTAELIFIRGPTDSWQTVNSIGGADNVFIENNTFNGSGYVCDINSNGRAVIRYNTITGKMKVDGHGIASNTPAHSFRHMEIYNNLWTNVEEGGSWNAIEFRGGTGRIFNNTINNTLLGKIVLKDYCVLSGRYSNCGDRYNCPSDYPITDQVGRGYITGDQDLEPLYLWNNSKNASTGTNVDAAVAACDEGDFTMGDIIMIDRDYFESEAKPAAMDGYTPYTYPHPLHKPSPLQNLRIK